MNNHYQNFEHNKPHEITNPFTALDLDKLLKERSENDNHNFLLLSIYFYLKHNNHHTTAENLFNEANLGKIFLFPQDLAESSENQMEILKKKFLNYFYYNTYFQQSDTNDFLSDFWNQFWEIFVTKIKQSNQTVSLVDNYLNECKLDLTYNVDTLHKNK